MVTWRFCLSVPPRRFSLSRVLNVEKRADGSQGSRYLVELELLEEGSVGPVRLSQYVYALKRHRGSRAHPGTPKRDPTVGRELLLCSPLGFAWDPQATVHFIVPGQSSRAEKQNGSRESYCVKGRRKHCSHSP